MAFFVYEVVGTNEKKWLPENSNCEEVALN
jgi:hypothetical protein